MALRSVTAFLVGEDSPPILPVIPGQPDDPGVSDGIWHESPTTPRTNYHDFEEHGELLQNLRCGQPGDLKDLENLLVESETKLGQKNRKIGLLKKDCDFFSGKKFSLWYKGRRSVNCGALCGAILGPHTIDWRAARRVAKEDDDSVSLSSSGIFSMRGQYKDADLDMGVFTHTDLKIVKLLIDLGADVEKNCLVDSRGMNENHHVFPIHLAAGTGNIAVLDLLLEKRANLDQQSELVKDGHVSAHVSALHEAAWFEQTHMVSHLLTSKINCNLQNLQGDTALHLACRQGLDLMLSPPGQKPEHLLAALAKRTNMQIKGDKNHDVIGAAIEAGRLSMDVISHLLGRLKTTTDSSLKSRTDSSFETWRRIAQSLAPRALQLCSRESPGSSQWRQAIRNAATASDSDLREMFLTSLANHDGLARVLLDVCTVPPRYHQAHSRRYNPMPVRCKIPANYPFMVAEIAEDHEWDWDRSKYPETKGQPPWQQRFTHNMKLGEEIDLRVCLFPNLVTVDFFEGVAASKDRELPDLPVVRAVVNLVWEKYIFKLYCVHLSYDLIVLAIVVLWSSAILSFDKAGESDSERVVQLLCWNFVSAVSAKRIIYECYEFCKSTGRHRTCSYCCHWANWKDGLFLLPLIAVCPLASAGAQPLMTGSHSRTFLSFCALSRWIKLLDVLRANRTLGLHITKFARSFEDFVNIAVLVLIVAGFTHALVSLQPHPEVDNLIFGFELLVLGEWKDEFVERAAEVSPITARLFMLAGVLVSVVGFLNLFIALISESYSEAKERADCLWLQDRAAVCAQWMVRPFRMPRYFQSRFNHPRLWWILLSIALGVGVSGGLFALALVSPGPLQHTPWLGLTLCILCADAGIVTLPANGKPGRPKWLCAIVGMNPSMSSWTLWSGTAMRVPSGFVRAKVVVCHCWDESFDELVDALEWYGNEGPFWICVCSLYQHFDTASWDFEKQYGKDPFDVEGAYRAVMQQANRLVVVITEKTEANPLERLFCRAEIACAMSLGKQVDIASATRLRRSQAELHDNLMDLHMLQNPLDKAVADLHCGRPDCSDQEKDWDQKNYKRLVDILGKFPTLSLDIKKVWFRALAVHAVPLSRRKWFSQRSISMEDYVFFLSQRSKIAAELRRYMTDPDSSALGTNDHWQDRQPSRDLARILDRKLLLSKHVTD
eukprot:s3767_g7.t1